jgi:hypothetical protein
VEGKVSLKGEASCSTVGRGAKERPSGSTGTDVAACDPGMGTVTYEVFNSTGLNWDHDKAHLKVTLGSAVKTFGLERVSWALAALRTCPCLRGRRGLSLLPGGCGDHGGRQAIYRPVNIW